jgi:ubiquinone/menaquinone biosynthesis C-methylase UbiE
MYSRAARYYDVFHSDKDYAAEAAAAHELIQAESPGASTLLDVACGTGRHLEHLRTHYEVEGLDIGPELLATARRRLPDVALHLADLTAFSLGRRFDAIVCLFSGIGYTRTRENLDRAARTLHRHLAPRGVLLVEPWLISPADTIGPFAEVFEEAGTKLARVGFGRAEGELMVTRTHYLVVAGDSIEDFSEQHELGLFEHGDYAAAFSRAGLRFDYREGALAGASVYVATPRKP